MYYSYRTQDPGPARLTVVYLYWSRSTASFNPWSSPLYARDTDDGNDTANAALSWGQHVQHRCRYHAVALVILMEQARQQKLHHRAIATSSFATTATCRCYNSIASAGTTNAGSNTAAILRSRSKCGDSSAVGSSRRIRP